MSEIVSGLSDNDDPLELDEVKLILSSLIRETHNKVITGRIRDEKKEEIRIKTINTLIQLSKTYVRMVESDKIQKLEKDVELLKKNYMAK
jgi:hypothetical protein